MQNLRLSVHGLVDFILRRGSIDTRVFNSASMMEGTRIHLRYQALQSGNYQSEVALEGTIAIDEFQVTLFGRADGILKTESLIIIDEIKSTVAPLESFFLEQGEWHLGQAICYAYLHATAQSLDKVGVRLTYISQKNEDKMIKDFVFLFAHLEKKVQEYVQEYLQYHRQIVAHKIERKQSAESLQFPFDVFRKGQRELAKYVYGITSKEGVFFFEAPTGTGKTISTLFPAVKTFAQDRNDKIFYLSAKSQAKEVAVEAAKKMMQAGLKIYTILLTAKDKMCFCPSHMCNPDDCPFAVQYYDKLKEAMQYFLFKHAYFDQESILIYARDHEMCPFELQLDLSLLCDVIICDYNYLFDPLVYLKRYFDEGKTNHIALIDEAHNLIHRSLEMYSESLDSLQFRALQSDLRTKKAVKIKRYLKKILRLFDEKAQESEGPYHVIKNGFDASMMELLQQFFKSMQEAMKEESDTFSSLLLPTFRSVNRFLKLFEFYDSSFLCFVEVKQNQTLLHLRCLDASNLLKETTKKLRAAVFFSATLTPLSYYVKRLGGDENTPTMKVASPFAKEHLLLLVRGDISTRYKDRAQSYRTIAYSIQSMVRQRKGNYLVFFPSYQYLLDVAQYFSESDGNIFVQTKEMTEKEKETFLSHFVSNPIETTIGFAVLGGSFSEGIDLVDDKLIGAVIVGVGLPSVGFETDCIKAYYDAQGVSGFDYAYTNPGMNKVMQAAGRVIRSQEDKGVVLLIDERFLSRRYQDLFKVEWSHYIPVFSEESIEHETKLFWEKK